MGALSTFSTAGLLDLTLRGGSFASPAAVYLGWVTTPPAADGSAVEVSGGGYSRKAITFLDPVDGTITQDAAVTWSTFHAGADQMVAGWGVWDAASGGNLLAFGRTPSYLVRMGAGFTVPAGGITIASNDAAMSDYLAGAWLGHLFRGDAFSAPADVYFGHYLVTPTASDPGTEVSAAGYDRGAATWDVPVLGASALGDTVTWAPLTTDEDQAVAGWALHDANSAGNVLWFYEWPTVIDVPAGDTFEFAIGSITLRVA